MLSDKWIKKYMRLAKQVGEDQNPCYSRQIGTVVVDPEQNRILGTGFNGPPRGVPHCDTSEYFEQIMGSTLSASERHGLCEKILGRILPLGSANHPEIYNEARMKFDGCHACPRKLLGCGPGERSSVCTCQHSERNALSQCSERPFKAWMFCWCGVPCQDCAGAIVNAGIERVYALDQPGPDYSPPSRWILSKGGVDLHLLKAEECLLTAV